MSDKYLPQVQTGASRRHLALHANGLMHNHCLKENRTDMRSGPEVLQTDRDVFGKWRVFSQGVLFMNYLIFG